MAVELGIKEFNAMFEEQFKRLVDLLAPPLPEEIGGIKLRKKINDILAPTLYHRLLPPMPKALANAGFIKRITKK